ncbi:flavin reductase family protein [Desulfuromonas acetoxidans]|uniref:Flavin reductase-like, FMN-binding n=1 Tax=Desulfuromonas acetoxidans (strain DSM 684 / 11070) TaxID=281689 RepID=Q1K0C0_DESA6|nr:flavin reductase family protein [Desulfuromonas acetoxidans]EAT16021.1 flavin reductase-like, FMN-binding [Desulfuromonas acetoxidans DSM 684]MBF0646803.1 flavin reductase family protein [Desulfuromonas acetoxidans]NVD24620.1 flavin reductase family protein [Desulfuromonas acetoxidans]NVE17983.1 flavin reductase family protein [Desulfuromonas acetoxidans]
MEEMNIHTAFTLLEPGPVILVTTNDGHKNNIMTISWTMVMDFTPSFALTTGPWNHSYAALRQTRECVLSIPTVDLLDQVIGVGTCSGRTTDKFSAFGLTPVQAECVKAPLIKECLANIECRVTEIMEDQHIVVLEGLKAWFDKEREETRTLHAIGDGTFIVDGQRLDRREMMQPKLPDGV